MLSPSMWRCVHFNQIMGIKRNILFCGPGSEIPEWFSFKNVGNSLTFHQHILDLSTSKLLGFAFSVVLQDKTWNSPICLRIGLNGKIFNFGQVTEIPMEFENVIIFYYPIDYFTDDVLMEMSGVDFHVCFTRDENPGKFGFYTTDRPIEPALEVKQCGARLIYEEDIGTNGEKHDDLT